MSPMWCVWSLCVVVVLGVAPGPGLAASEAHDPHAIMQRMASAYDGIRDYTALFLKRERIKGVLLPLETIELRFQAPFKVYMAWRELHAGRVIVYVEGANDNKILINPGGLLRFLRLKLEPTSSRPPRIPTTRFARWVCKRPLRSLSASMNGAGGRAR